MSDHSKFFKKYTLNNKVEVPSLLAVAPLTLFGSNPDGTIADDERNFFKQRAKGIGLYILGACCVSLEGLAFDNQPRAFNDKDIPSNKERAKIIKDQGALAINQIHHGGCLGLKRLSGVPVMAVSAVSGKGIKELLYKICDVLSKCDSEPVTYEQEFFPDDITTNDEPVRVYYDSKEKEYVVEGSRVERMLGYTNLDSEKGFDFFQKFLRNNGIIEELEKLGINEGDTVRLYSLSFEYYK